MPKQLFLAYFLLLSNIAYSQHYTELHEIYTCQNKNGVLETLKVGSNHVYYSSSINRQEVQLNVTKGTNDMRVSFPNDEKAYILSFEGMYVLQCANPDGSKQLFSHQSNTVANLGLYKTINKNGIVEFLEFSSDGLGNIKTSYYTSVNPSKIHLLSKNVQQMPICMGNYTHIDLQYPQDNKNYSVNFLFTTKAPYLPYLLCTNPDNTIQKFDWIKK